MPMRTQRTRRQRRTWPLAWLTLPLLAMLAGCMSRPDSLAPMIAITEPKSGATSSTEVLRIYGYALDDEGIAAIRVNGTDLMQFEENAGARGKSLIQFAFQGRPEREGEAEFLIEVEDTSGRVTVLPYVLTVDTTPPSLELEAEALGGGRYRVRGVARDNTEVSSIRLGGQPLQFAPAPEYSFEFSNVALAEPTIVVVDSAGNRIERSVE
ncbi:MAG TPA: hypothetical protein VF168_13390 [Trueperaceae bacterium]